MNIRVAILTIAFASIAFALDGPQAAAQTCRWAGTAPFCSGECGEGETQRTQAWTADYDPGTVGVQGLESVNKFGETCVTGTKAYCCKTPGVSCRWDGTAPFCGGECKSGETETPLPPGSSSGASCWTGHKVYCCHSTGSVGSTHVPQRLTAIPPQQMGVIYGVTPVVPATLPTGVGPGMGGHPASGGDLMWYRHVGREDGSFTWVSNGGKKVGSGWGEFKQLFSGGDGIIYAVTAKGDLMWYRHVGREDGTFQWASAGKKVGVGWGELKQVFSGGDGVIYGVTAVVPASLPTGVGPGMGGHPASGGDLMWYRHAGREDGSFQWVSNGGKKVGSGWGEFKQLFSGGDGIIYGVTANGDLMWYRHVGREDGTFQWASAGKKVGVGWGEFKQLFSGGDGVIYGVTAHGDLMWYRHVGREDGTFKWASPNGKKVGVGWGQLKQQFAD